MRKYSIGLVMASIMLVIGVFVFSTFITQAASSGLKFAPNSNSVSDKCSKKSVRVLSGTVYADETLDGSYQLSALTSDDFSRLGSVILQGCKMTLVLGKVENSNRITYQCLSATQSGNYFRCYSIGSLTETETDGSAVDLINPILTIHDSGGESAVSDVDTLPAGSFALTMMGRSASTGNLGRGDALGLDSPGSTTELNIFAAK